MAIAIESAESGGGWGSVAGWIDALGNTAAKIGSAYAQYENNRAQNALLVAKAEGALYGIPSKKQQAQAAMLAEQEAAARASQNRMLLMAGGALLLGIVAWRLLK